MFALLMIGGAFLFGLNPLKLLPTWAELKIQAKKLLGRLQSGKKQTLRRKVQQSQGKTKANFFTRNLADARRILTSTNQQGKIKLMTRCPSFVFARGLSRPSLSKMC